MKAGKYSWLKKNPLVLLMRRIYKFLNSLFKPKKNLHRSSLQYQVHDTEAKNLVPLEEKNYVQDAPLTGSFDTLPSSQPENYIHDELVTIGDLFEQVAWQSDKPKIQSKITNTHKNIRVDPGIPDKEKLVTIGMLLKQVKWRVPPAIIQEQFLNTSKFPRTHDVSRN